MDIPLLRKTVEFVEAQENLDFSERQWYQRAWVVDTDYGDARPFYNEETFEYEHKSCGTAFCAAGFIALEAGYTAEQIAESPNPGDLAAEILGVNPDSIRHMWYGSNSAADIREIAEKVAGEKL